MSKNSIDLFFQSQAFAVAGASTNREKYGNKVVRCYLQHHKTVYPINPRASLIEGVPVCSSVNELPIEVASISIITPPSITEEIVAEAIKKGIKHIWMQPGAESKKAMQLCADHQLNLIAQGPCISVVLGFNE